MFDQRDENDDATHQKKSNVKKKTKVKITIDFTVNKKTLNAKASERDENYVQLTLHRRVINEFFKSNYRN